MKNMVPLDPNHQMSPLDFIMQEKFTSNLHFEDKTDGETLQYILLLTDDYSMSKFKLCR